MQSTSDESHPKDFQPGLFGASKEIATEFADDDVMTQAAAIAFYSGLAMAPLLALSVFAARVFFGNEAKQQIVTAFQQIVGEQGAAPIRELLDPASQHAASGLTFASIISLAILAFSASSVFGQLQSALNEIWDVRAKPKNNILGFISKRLLSLGMLLSILFLLMVSLVVSTVIQGFFSRYGSNQRTLFWSATNNLASIVMFTVVFAGLFKYVPDAKIEGRAVWAGGLISALLFAAGKLGLAVYLGRGSYQNSYGVAVGSFVALLVWVYYSAVIVLFGAEATKVYARRLGHAVLPSDHAVKVIREEAEVSPDGQVRKI